MTNPTVTVLVCTRDRPQQLVRCLESLLTLDYPSLEILVVDNGSSSFTVPDLNYPIRTRFFAQPVPGLSFARNSVLAFAEGEVIALLDDDATADALWLKKAGPHFENPRVACVTGKVLPLAPANASQMRQWSERWAKIPDHPTFFDQDHYDPFNSLVGTGTNVLVRSLFIRKHGFSEVFGPGTPCAAGDEDELFYRMVEAGHRIDYEPEAVVYHEYPLEEGKHEQQQARYAASRGAFLTYLLLFGRRTALPALGHLLRKFSSSNRKGAHTGSRARGILRGPLTLWRSRRFARRHYRIRGECSLLADFPGRSEHMLVKPQV